MKKSMKFSFVFALSVLVTPFVFLNSEPSFAMGSPCVSNGALLTEEEYLQQKEYSWEEIQNDSELFFYRMGSHNYVYRLVAGQNGIPRWHQDTFQKRNAEMRSEITEKDLDFHNERLRNFIFDSEKIIGRIEFSI